MPLAMIKYGNITFPGRCPSCTVELDDIGLGFADHLARNKICKEGYVTDLLPVIRREAGSG